MINYVAINRDILIDNTKVGCDLYLKTYVNGSPKYVLFCRGDELFSSERRKELIEQNKKKTFC
ncbi:MAG: protein contains HD-GYP domain protein [Candidatus Scalindua rubra]|uniref:Protein contains HD-GYP domain protein n=1 Tax=Candidatus Scalindua rubra TaxID=1872076 RepID=A0A1E3XBS8_9BACT|nr:MAG: protein contains HD-GYP domain protein [Candidatus Scalindua rubra]